jgi:hypothetical protein
MKHLEDDMTIAVANYLRMQYPSVLWTHSPNGGRRNPREGARFKRMGVLKGVSDFLIFESNMPNVRGVAIELKVKPNKPTPEQLEFINRLKSLKWEAHVCYSFEEAKIIIDKYLN